MLKNKNLFFNTMVVSVSAITQPLLEEKRRSSCLVAACMLFISYSVKVNLFV